jgi:hypothetical protein
MDLPYIIFLAVSCLVIGYILACLVQNLFSIKSNPSEANQGEIQTADDKTRAGYEDPISARLVISEETPGFWIEMGGEVYHSFQDLNQAQQELLTALVHGANAWIARELEEPVVVEPAPDNNPPAQLNYLKESPVGSVKPVSMNPVNALFNALSAENQQALPKHLLSLAEQIDEILQEKIRHTRLAHRGIRLATGIDNSLDVWVGLNKYEKLENVPDDEIRSAIQEAVHEWEKRTT